MRSTEASARARQLWVPFGSGPLPLARARRKIAIDRYEVGYLEHGLEHVLGRGSSWEAAFARAAYRPLSLDVLADARQDTVHIEPEREARPVRTRK